VNQTAASKEKGMFSKVIYGVRGYVTIIKLTQ